MFKGKIWPTKGNNKEPAIIGSAIYNGISVQIITKVNNEYMIIYNGPIWVNKTELKQLNVWYKG